MTLRPLNLITFCCLFVAAAGLQAQGLTPLQALSNARQNPAGDVVPDAGFKAINLGAGGRVIQAPAAANGAAAGGGTAVDRDGGLVMPGARLVAAPPNEFQKFVLESTGNLLPIFGADFFATARGYAPLQGTPVAGDYPLGPGDEVMIRGWGTIDVDYRAVIDRNGLINIPKVGTVALAGVRAANAEDVVRGAFDKVFRGFTLNVTIGQLRGISVYVVGQARFPGTYTVSSLSTIVTALFESGGPGANGSLRQVQVKRAGKLVAELDLYAFLAQGDKSADIRLLDGDVIVIPPAHGFVALTGKVETPAVYELKPGDTIQSLLAVAGGLPVLADPRRAFIERIDPTHRQPRNVEEFVLDAAGLSKPLKNGDLISVLAITPEFANAVTLRGGVNQALRVPYREGMKIRDLIPNKEFLLSRSTLRRQNSDLITQQRRDAANERKQYPFEQSLLKQAQRPEVLPASDPDLERKTYVDSIGNRYDEFNWDYAVVERLNRAELTETLVSFHLGRAMADAASADNIALQAGDTVTVFSADDVRVPIAKRKVFVRLEGEVRRPGVYQVASGETLINMLEKAGGLTADAYLFGAEFGRESVRRSQRDNMESFIRRIEQQSLSNASKLAANTLADNAQSAIAMQSRMAFETESRTRLIQRLRELKSNGRIALGLPMKDASMANIPAFRLENGDRLMVPNRPDFVQVIGSVSTEAALLWQPGRSVSDYLSMAGVGPEADRDSILVMRADGSVASSVGRWISSVSGLELMPGDIVVVPEMSDKETFWTAFMRNAKDITQVFSNFGLGAAAIKSLRE